VIGTILLALAATLVAAPPLRAGTFERSSIAPDLGLEAFTREVARQRLGRDLFANPYATVTLGNVDLYDVFPYVESRTFQVVSDPRWNRLVYGEAGRSLRAYDGAGGPLGALSEPRGLAVDERNRLYVADAGNDRVVVLGASTEFGDMELLPLYEIGGFSRPHDVAYSDGGTPFALGDDVLYVADTGRNRVVALALEDGGARPLAALGELGAGRGRFAGPLAVAAGRAGGASTREVYVADAHTRRIVHLRHAGTRLDWVAEVRHDAQVVTSLAADAWGNLYASAPHQGVVLKLNSELAPVAELRGQLASPRGFHVPFVTVRDHRDGRQERLGRPHGVSVDRWTDHGGLSLWRLGLEVTGLVVEPEGVPTARFHLTDRADVTLELCDAWTGRSLARRAVGRLDAGAHAFRIADEDLGAAEGVPDVLLRLSAASAYPEGPVAVAKTPLRGGGAAPAQALLLGSRPNPATRATRIAFLLPEGGAAGASLRVLDAAGRLVRVFERGFSPGLNEVLWDGADLRGRPVPAGVYFYRLEVGGQSFTRRLTLVP
jgi:hypothetical protein